MTWIKVNATALQGLLGTVLAGVGVGMELGRGWGVALVGLVFIANTLKGRQRRAPE